jgi:hypothetical protein
LMQVQPLSKSGMSSQELQEPLVREEAVRIGTKV